MKKRILVLALAFCLLLAACSRSPAQTAPGETDVSETDVQNKYLLSPVIGFFEHDGAFFGTDWAGSFLRYYDQATGDSGILCADPACTHSTADCGAYVGRISSLSYYDGKLYWVARQEGGKNDDYLWRADMGGMNREKVKRLDFQEIMLTYQPQRYFIHRGQFYFLGSADIVDGVQAGKRITLLSSPLDGSEEFTPLFDLQSNTSANASVRFVGDCVYFLYRVFPETSGGPYAVTLTRLDTRSGTYATLLDADLEISPSRLWVTVTEEIYLSGSNGTNACFWKLEEGKLKEIASWSGASSTAPYILDGVVLYSYQDGGVRHAEILDFEGNPIYNGPLFPDGVPGLDGDPNAYFGGVIGGDREKIILDRENILDSDGDKSYVILLDLQNGLKPTILWSNIT